jgi:predicted TIM-barrel fold metal-dependent hydrolase
LDFGIVDCHAHIFPPLAGACGFPDQATHALHQQRAMHVHGNQPYRRARDHAISTERPLWDANDPSEDGRARDVKFGAGSFGRFEWEAGGERYYVQFLPPYMRDLSAPADMIAAQMTYAGISTAVLQNDHIYGNLAEDFAEAARRHPGRFIGLAQIEEAFGFRDDQIAALIRQVETLGMAGLYFTTTGMFRNGYKVLHSDRSYDALWSEVEKRALPVFWVQSARSPIGSYEDEMRHLRAIIERFPGIRHVLVHGVPTAIYADDHDRFALPAIVEELLTRCPVASEVLYPIAWGGRHEYPYVRARTHIRQLYDRFGPGRLVWGSDMPNVERYCTYRQTLTYVTDHCAFLSAADRRLIFRDNALALFRKDLIAGA